MLRTFVLFHHHEYGSDVRTFNIDDGHQVPVINLYDNFPPTDELARLLDLNYEPNKGETIDISELYDCDRYLLYQDDQDGKMSDLKQL
jgi:hypothetical protein